MTATYREYAPSRLADVVECFWTIRGRGAPDAPPNRVLPDNCMDVIFDFTTSGGPRIVGAMLEAIVLREEGAIDMLGVRFKPGAAPLFLGIAASELTASIVAADDVWPGTESLNDMLRSCAPEHRIGLFEAWLAERLRPAAHADRARAAMAAIAQSRGAISLASLCSLVSTSNRTLLRSFMDNVGVGPKVALRVARVQTAARMLERNPEIPISQVALECGYSDQPHFTHDFDALAGLAPNAYREERRLVRFLQDQANAAR